MSWKPAWKIVGEGDKWCMNAQVFATKEEAQSSASRRYSNWTATSAYGAEETTDPVDYRWDAEKGDVFIEKDE